VKRQIRKLEPDWDNLMAARAAREQSVVFPSRSGRKNARGIGLREARYGHPTGAPGSIVRRGLRHGRAAGSSASRRSGALRPPRILRPPAVAATEQGRRAPEPAAGIGRREARYGNPAASV